MTKLSTLVGNNIRNQRNKHNMNQERLALLADIDRSYMGRIERGEVNITLKKLYKIFLVLECEPFALVPSIEEI